MLNVHGTTEAPGIARRVREEITHHAPRPGAMRRVSFEAPAAPDGTVDYTRLSGPRADVLDYAALLFATDSGYGATALKLVAVEQDDEERLTLLLGRPQ
jgi:hypothetical protein